MAIFLCTVHYNVAYQLYTHMSMFFHRHFLTILPEFFVKLSEDAKKRTACRLSAFCFVTCSSMPYARPWSWQTAPVRESE